jgi:murein DD-endopeptidase MepM/ murein hydrolase activator NlpD
VRGAFRNVLTFDSFIMVLLLIGTTLCFPLFASAAEPAAHPQPEIVLSPSSPGPGDIMIVTVKGMNGPVDGTFNDKKIHFNPSQDAFRAVVGIDLFTEPGSYPLSITSTGGTEHRTIAVQKKVYPVQHLTLPKGMVELSPENEARVERELKLTNAIWPNETNRVWDGGFMNPREGKIVTLFGVRRFMNKIPKNPHTGVDVEAEEGDPVRAPNNGIVRLVDDLYYSGNSVVLDHGQGLYTMFFHLSKVLVKQGQQVKKGDVIALVGSTGRSTGAHLHWGVRLQGARVDPMELIKLDLEEETEQRIAPAR